MYCWLLLQKKQQQQQQQGNCDFCLAIASLYLAANSNFQIFFFRIVSYYELELTS